MAPARKTNDGSPRTLQKVYDNVKMHALIGFCITIIIIIMVFAWLYYDGETFLDGEGEKTYRVSWDEKTGPQMPYSRELMEREELVIESTVAQTNITAIQFELFWEDERGGLIRNLSDDVTMKVEGPPNAQVKFHEPNPLEGYQSPLLITATVNPIPNDLTFMGIEPSELSSRLTDYSATNGVGTWNVILSIDAHPPLDRGNAVSLVVTYHYYEPHIKTVP